MSASIPAREKRVDLVEQELVSSLARFITIRWLAGLGVLAASWVVTGPLRLPLPAPALYLIGLAVLAYNAVCQVILKRLLAAEPLSIVRFERLTKAQIGLDWLAMTALLHFSGGVESPALFYFFFHIILSGIFLSPAATYFYAATATVLVGATVWLEYAGRLAHYSPFAAGSGPLFYRRPTFVLGVILFFVSAMFVAAYLASTINVRVRRREREIVELSDNLRIAYGQLQDLEETKSRFVLTVTHELRSPVGVIRSLLQTLRDGYAGGLTADQRDLVSRALHRADFLQALINDLLDLAAGKREFGLGTEELVPVRLEPVVRQVIERFEASARERGVGLGFREGGGAPAVVLAAPEGLDRILNNLVSNAVKYTPPGGRVAVSLEAGGGEARLEVEDTGIGIPGEALDHLYEEFYRARNAKVQVKEGTGLGLSIVRDLVVRYGGQISVRSELGRGTIFALTFPLARGEGATL